MYQTFRKKYTVVVVYKSPTYTNTEFYECLRKISLFPFQGQVILMGDFNIDIADNPNTNFLNIVHNMFPSVRHHKTPPTTFGNTAIDLAFTSCKNTHCHAVCCI